MKILLVIFVVLMAVLCITACTGNKGPGSVISLGELKKQIAEQKGLLLIDVRTPEEFAAGRIPGAVNVPLQVIEKAITGAVPQKDTYFIVYCRTGRRSAAAAETLKAMGYMNFRNYRGSFAEWSGQGNPVEK